MKKKLFLIHSAFIRDSSGRRVSFDFFAHPTNRTMKKRSVGTGEQHGNSSPSARHGNSSSVEFTQPRSKSENVNEPGGRGSTGEDETVNSALVGKDGTKDDAFNGATKATLIKQQTNSQQCEFEFFQSNVALDYIY